MVALLSVAHLVALTAGVESPSFPCSSSVPVSLVSLMECPLAPLEVEVDHSPWLSHDSLVPAQVERLSFASSPAEDSLTRIVGPSGLSKPVLALT